MENLIDYTSFKYNLSIANVTDEDVQQNIRGIITNYQLDFLKRLLGNQLYDQLDAWYNVDPTDETSVFYYLLNGQSFFNGYCNFGWIGLRKPLANYVYFYYQRDNATQTTSSGEAKTNAKNAYRAGPYDKMKSAWDQMVEWLAGFKAFMDYYFSASVASVTQPIQLPYRAPIQIQVGVTIGLLSGTTSFVFDGTNGTPDWRKYDIFPERIGQGTMIRGVQYLWDIPSGTFSLLEPGDSFQPNEFFNITFGQGGFTYMEIASYEWQSYRNGYQTQGFNKVITPF